VHGTKTNSAAAPRFAVAAARSKKRSVFVEKHVLLNWLKPGTSILFRVFQVGVRPPSSVDRRSEPQCHAGVNLNLPPAKVSEESGIKAESSSSHKFETFKPRFSLSVDRREVVFHRACSNTSDFLPEKNMVGDISRRMLPMKRVVRLMFATLVLLGAISTAFICRRRGSATHVFTGALRREVSRRTRKVKI
jgi:hypothetical protein